MHSCDVLIVGGGPAGSTLAWSLRESGRSVTILDRKTFPRDKVCAGWVTPEVLRALRIDPEAYGKERTIQPITGFRVSLLGHKQVETHYAGETVSYGIRRFEFDHYLLQRAGAHLRLGTDFKSMARDGAGWLVNGEIRAGLVVGAGGHFCPVARALAGRTGGAEPVVAAQEIEFEMTPEQAAACRVDPEVPELFFLPELNGYGWIFRKGDWLNIGLGREHGEKLTEHVQDFRERIIAEGKVPADIPTKFKGHAYLLYDHAPREVIHDGALLIGDSAGLAYPDSGEGIRPAVESALLAGRMIAAVQGDYRRETLQTYYAQLTDRFGARQPPPGLRDRVPQSLKRWLAVPLLRTHWFVRGVLIDQWFLHRDLPPLAGS